MWELLRDLWDLVRTRKKYWLLPLIVVMVLLGVLLVLGPSSSVGPFIYTLF